MKHFLGVSGLMLMMLSGCAALPENGKQSDVQAASDVGAQIASDVAAPSVQAASEINKPTLVHVQDDVKVLPTHTEQEQKKPTPNKKDKTDKEKSDKSDNKTPTPAKLNVTLRNQPKVTDKKTKANNSKTPKNRVVKTSPVVVKLPPAKPAKPVLTRRQVLEQEITRERNALKTARKQLAAAQKSGNAKQITKFNAAIRDRELNIRAIEMEMKR